VIYSSKECVLVINIGFCKIDVIYSSKECVLIINIGFCKIAIAFFFKGMCSHS